jgi:pimeloyl-ACP methyl ester carboxylesterase
VHNTTEEQQARWAVEYEGGVIRDYRDIAVVAHSPFSSVEDIIDTLVVWETGWPPWLARMVGGSVLFWAGREIDCDLSMVSAKEWIGDISPRAVFILHGENDRHVPADSGEVLYAAAGEPKEYWFCPDSGHHECDTDYPQEFESRIIGFFDQYLTN